MNSTIDEMIDFLLFEKGENIQINSVSQKAFILEAAEKINQDADKYIHCKFEIKTGDIIDYRNKKYIISSQIIKSTNSYSAKLKQCTYSIAFNFTGNVKWFNTYIETKVMDIETNQYMSLASGTIVVTIQENANSKNIALAQRFINTGRAWEVTGIDRSNIGLIRLYCDLTGKTADDDMVNEIADYNKYAHNYAISVSNQQPVGVAVGATAQLIFVVTNGTSAVTPQLDLICTSSAQAVATVTNTGLITGIAAGTAVITCTIAEYPNVSVQVNIEVKATVADSYSITISGNTKLKVGGSNSTYTSTIYNNGTAVSGKAVTWSIRNADTSTTARATISSYTDLTCKAKAPDISDSIGAKVILKATLSDNSNIYYEYQISLISL